MSIAFFIALSRFFSCFLQSSTICIKRLYCSNVSDFVTALLCDGYRISITLTFNSSCTSSSLNASDNLSSSSVTFLPSFIRSSLPLYNTVNSGVGIFKSFFLYILSFHIVLLYILKILMAYFHWLLTDALIIPQIFHSW